MLERPNRLFGRYADINLFDMYPWLRWETELQIYKVTLAEIWMLMIRNKVFASWSFTLDWIV